MSGQQQPQKQYKTRRLFGPNVHSSASRRRHCKEERVKDGSQGSNGSNAIRKTSRPGKLRKERCKLLKIKVVNTVVMCFLGDSGYQTIPYVNITDHKLTDGEQQALTSAAKQSSLHFIKEMLVANAITQTPAFPYQCQLALIAQPVMSYPGMLLPQIN